MAVLTHVNDTTLTLLADTQDTFSAKAPLIKDTGTIAFEENIGVQNQVPQLRAIVFLAKVKVCAPLALAQVRMKHAEVR